MPLDQYFSSLTNWFQDKNGRNQKSKRELIQKLSVLLSIPFLPEKEPEGNVCLATSPEVRPEFRTSFAPIDLLDYIYAVLHSPTYRVKYKVSFKINFPRVPYPADAARFWQFVSLGSQLRQLHLLESPTVDQFITQYPIEGDNVVDNPRFETYIYSPELPDENGELHYPDFLGNVLINDTQFFSGVPTSAWELNIGGYQPARKWLKKRKGYTLTYEDILDYQRIIVALTETNRLMQELDRLEMD